MFVPRTGRRWLPVPLDAAGLVLLAACGASTEATPSTADPAAFAECMNQPGVPAPERGTRINEPRPDDGRQGAPVTRRNAPPPPDGVDPEAWEAALEACDHLGVRRTLAPRS